ncbi:endothelin-converting enzyme-like 1 (damage-induced neuronal endopeptidase) [Schistosoma mansoni]|nr:endothelin-converting enzyme-like 1 (damage-induced neuronal endopeptidase) [Schistosoma mansoni]|eukprot:XP_018650200.1 endothelin-converting enzyme-like 1 (damage-induced neuronal endopeptidase) [Schistosoma mansoni]
MAFNSSMLTDWFVLNGVDVCGSKKASFLKRL